MRNILNKIVFLFLALIIAFSVITSPVKAGSPDEVRDAADSHSSNPSSSTSSSTTAGSGSYLDNIDDHFGNRSDNSGLDKGEDAAKKIIIIIISILQIIGVGISVIMLLVLGMKYMIASIEERAKIKEHAVVYVLGALVFFSAAGILKIIQIFVEKNFVV